MHLHASTLCKIAGITKAIYGFNSRVAKVRYSKTCCQFYDVIVFRSHSVSFQVITWCGFTNFFLHTFVLKQPFGQLGLYVTMSVFLCVCLSVRPPEEQVRIGDVCSKTVFLTFCIGANIPTWLKTTTTMTKTTTKRKATTKKTVFV